MYVCILQNRMDQKHIKGGTIEHKLLKSFKSENGHCQWIERE